jgi:hypothetical protein
MPRDMTQKQFDLAVARAGWKREGFLGYYRFERPDGDGSALCVSIYNAGPLRRERLAYLHAQADKYLATF